MESREAQRGPVGIAERERRADALELSPEQGAAGSGLPAPKATKATHPFPCPNQPLPPVQMVQSSADLKRVRESDRRWTALATVAALQCIVHRKGLICEILGLSPASLWRWEKSFKQDGYQGLFSRTDQSGPRRRAGAASIRQQPETELQLHCILRAAGGKATAPTYRLAQARLVKVRKSK